MIYEWIHQKYQHINPQVFRDVKDRDVYQAPIITWTVMNVNFNSAGAPGNNPDLVTFIRKVTILPCYEGYITTYTNRF